ncbi:alpha/beta hydrolase [Pollutimonas harenae]|uniref:Alpha/beta hydrolase n=1 Tax=Pollutimonas harenae TaxID=657015 RepID=A0A853H147_9BURK|nr:alpha/beta hydrolase [Pollutimonas harenae]NYT84293.1 alpha/beta hydrolase [Pollutimonas harenae]TEA73301.1 alpha/beta hydrolase [Pollutimonas harenae]
MLARTEKITFQGEAGVIDCALDLPMTPPIGWALVLHPHPLHGGARDNKIVTTISRACVERGLMAVRPNFRGVGESAGEFDAAVGETADMQQLVRQFAQAHPEAAAGKWVLAGFSFGTSVAAQLYSVLAEQSQAVPDALLLFGPAVERFKFRTVSVPDDTLLVHGEADEVVPLSEAMSFAQAHDLPVTVVPGASHFFHGKLVVLKRLLQQRLGLL